tara:strand:+ start:2631 stop:3734 length:1104 start_codon:yes stop_codon:yes gene_type:complete
MNDYRIGVAFFKDSIKGENGIAYSKTNLLEKVDNINDLDDKIIWFTNIRSELEFPLKIKKNNFFTESMTSIIYQKGMKNEPLESIVKELFDLYLKIINNISKEYNVDIDEERFSLSLNKSYKIKKYNIKEEKIIEKLENNVSAELTSVKRNKNKKQLFLTTNKYNYFKKICKTMFPIGIWKHLKYNDIKNKDKEWFNNISKKYHFIISVKITKINPALNSILPYKYKNSKVWINNYEYEFLKNYCNIFIDEMLISKQKVYLESIQQKKLYKVKPYEETYLSNSIAATIYMNSFLENNNIMSYWLKIQDKTNMLKIAFIFSKMNIDVLSYGSGSVLISYDNTKEEINKIISICDKLNLNYPLELLSLY